MSGVPAAPGSGALSCPGCGGGTMEMRGLDPSVGGDFAYRGCELRSPTCLSCGGVWLDRALLAQIIDAAAEAATPGRPRDIARRLLTMGVEIVYRSCPRCDERMRRRNFGTYSGVVVHECLCGTYFEHGDLSAVVSFVRTGGLALSQPEISREPRTRRPTVGSDLPRRPSFLRLASSQPREHGKAGEFLAEFARWLLRGAQLVWAELRARTSRRPRQ